MKYFIKNRSKDYTDLKFNLNRKLILSLLIAVCLFHGGQLQASSTSDIQKNKRSERLKKLEKSRLVWLKYKKIFKGNYSYSLGFFSEEGNFGYSTIIIIRNNKVTGRKYSKYKFKKRKKQVTELWSEKSFQIGRHKEGGSATTIDQLYKDAKKAAQHKLAAYERFSFNVDKRGILSSCYYYDFRIADDAPQHGVIINLVKFGK
jgi:hypothetical protein